MGTLVYVVLDPTLCVLDLSHGLEGDVYSART